MKRMLLIEDDSGNRDLAHFILAKPFPDWSIEESSTAEEALTMINNSPYNLILLDYHLPGMDGLELLEKIRASKRDPPVIMVTGRGSEKIAVEALSKGVTEYVIKDQDFQTSLVSTVQRVVEKTKVANELKRTQEEGLFQAEKHTTIGKIIAEILHELRNPIAILSTSLESIRDSKDKSMALEKSLHLMLSNVARARDIVNNLLDFSRPKQYEFRLSNMQQVLEELIGYIKLKCEKQKIEIQFKADKNLPDIQMDIHHIKGCLLNLLLNAIEAMPNGGRLTVSVKKAPGKKNLSIEITDTGQGISPDDQKRLFQRFFTTKPQGSGLGLLIAHQVITRHGGFINVRSELGKGTSFTLHLPLEKADEKK